MVRLIGYSTQDLCFGFCSLVLSLRVVGGLGLNLTSADTVIFVENDWNPMRDLQVYKICRFCFAMKDLSFIDNHGNQYF